MWVEPHEEDPNVNIVLQSGITMGDDKGKQPEDITWVRKAPKKEAKFDLDHARETLMKAKKSFIEAFPSGSKDKLDEEMHPSMLMTFLETCMKLLQDSKVMEGLQELINRCDGNTPGESHMVQNIGKLKARIGREMRLTMQIGEYEMDQGILDLGLC